MEGSFFSFLPFLPAVVVTDLGGGVGGGTSSLEPDGALNPVLPQQSQDLPSRHKNCKDGRL